MTDQIQDSMQAVALLRDAARKVFDTLSKDEFRTKREQSALDGLENAFYNTQVVNEKWETAVDQVERIRDVLWPNGDMDHRWEASTIDEVAEIVDPRLHAEENNNG
ncbi:hypothetical protein UFOVP276_18 [uncultured Caudovirales phage]|uniref:Uncharacterized protein n=1 Tax=uncultured Caudovirales phage TaxID=2100421 RepID=A0A6J5LKT1_9CAUD|nr:hypothetical protein UFOVP127_155 [uncultured Caudovirales phage]CAB4134831.1 hypothetical protein UFOVP276_18 [uncultured Caudovirales phage]